MLSDLGDSSPHKRVGMGCILMCASDKACVKCACRDRFSCTLPWQHPLFHIMLDITLFLWGLGFFAEKGCFEQEATAFTLPCLCHQKYTRQGELSPAVSERSFCVAVV